MMRSGPLGRFRRLREQVKRLVGGASARPSWPALWEAPLRFDPNEIQITVVSPRFVAAPSQRIEARPFDRGSLDEVIEREVRPGLQADGGDIEVLDWSVASGILQIRLVGACSGCPSAGQTVQEGITRILKSHFSDLVEVVAV